MELPEQPPDNACLFLDVDGTLIDLAPTPDAVVVPDKLVEELGRLEDLFGGALALVSGRSIADLDRLFAPLVLKTSGVHGAEFRLPGNASQPGAAARPLPAETWADLQALLGTFPGTFAENKAYSFAVHYRACPESGPLLVAALERFSGERGDLGLKILPGHFVYELKRPGFDKGAAIRTMMACPPFAGRVPVFIGDDVTDMPGFAAVTALGGRAYSVKARFAGVAGTFGAPADVRDWLAHIGRAGDRSR